MLDDMTRSLWRTLAVIGACSGLVLVFATTMNVVSRILGRPLAGMLELSELTLVAMVFLSLGYTEQQDGQVSTDIVFSRLPASAQAAITRLTTAIFAVLMTVVAYGSWTRALKSYQEGEVKMGLLAWPLWPGRLLVALGFTSIVVALALKAISGPGSGSTSDVSSKGI